MDDNAQTQPVQQPTVQTDQAQQIVQPQDPNQTPAPVAPPQQATRPLEAPEKTQQISGGGGKAEQGPVSSFQANEDPDDDDQPVVQQEAPVIQQSHPEVVLPQEVKDAGVTEGKDADPNQLPEVKQAIHSVPSPQPDPVAVHVVPPPDPMLTMSFEQAQEAEKKTKSAKNGLTWIIKEVIREWKKKSQPEEEK